MSSAFIKANKAVVESLFAQGVNWSQQEDGITASNGAPSLATDGVPVNRKAGYALQIVDTSGTAVFDVQVWGYANDAWTKIPSGVYSDLDEGGMCEIGVGGVFDNIYIEIIYTSGTLDVNIGVANS